MTKGKSCSATIELADIDSAMSIVDELHDGIVLGRRVKVNFMVPTEEMLRYFQYSKRFLEAADAFDRSAVNEQGTSGQTENQEKMTQQGSE